MPIIDENVSSQASLSQGDVLKGLKLFSTKQPWLGGGEADPLGVQYSLVISRPCALAHGKNSAIVAAVGKYPVSPPSEAKSFDEVRAFLEAQRDGLRTPDNFYLGTLPNETGRFAARLDSLHTIEIPNDEGERRTFASTHRVGRLMPDFARDLHLRILRAFASLGFDDHSWFSDDDLEWLVNCGNRDLLQAQSAALDAKSSEHRREFSGTSVNAKGYQEAEGKAKAIEEKLQPYIREKERRTMLGSGDSSANEPNLQ